MLGLGFPERPDRRDFSHDPAGPQARGLDVGNCVLGHRFLIAAGVVNCRAVARTRVIALTVLRRWIVNLEKELEQRAKTCLLGIEHNLDCFGMVAVIAIGRV